MPNWATEIQFTDTVTIELQQNLRLQDEPAALPATPMNSKQEQHADVLYTLGYSLRPQRNRNRHLDSGNDFGRSPMSLCK